MTRVVFFDVDGVLLDTLAAKGEAFVQAFSDFPKFAPSIRSIHLSNGGVSRDVKVSLMLEHVLSRPPSQSEVEERVAKFADDVVGRVLASREIPGASAALTDLSADHILHAISATPASELHDILEARDWSHFFRSIHGYPSKKSATLRYLMNAFGYLADECVMIGDSSEDRRAARDNGVPFVLVEGSISPDPEDVAAIPDLVTLPVVIRNRSRLHA